MIGGPCGRPIRYPNSKVKRGWSQTRALWRFEGVETMPLTVLCAGHWYRRVAEDGKWFYVDDGPVTTSPWVVRAIAGSPFWQRVLGEFHSLTKSGMDAGCGLRSVAVRDGDPDGGQDHQDDLGG